MITQEQALREAKALREKILAKISSIGFRTIGNEGKFSTRLADAIVTLVLEYSSSKDKEIEELKKDRDLWMKQGEENFQLAHKLKSQLQQATASSSSGEREDAISQLNQELKETDETLTAKLRNALSPHYGLPSMISKLRERPEILKMVEDTAEQALKNNLRIDTLLNALDALPHPSTKQFDIDKLILWIKSDKVKIEVSDILTQIEVIKLQSLTPSSHTEVKDKPKGEGSEVIESFIEFEKSQKKTIRGGIEMYDVKGEYKYLTFSELFQLFLNQPLTK